MLPAPSPGIWLQNTSSFFLQPITPCAISSLCTTVHGFWRGFHLNMSIKENLKYKKNCLWVWNVWRMFKLFHALGWSLNDSWFGTYASQTLCASQFWALEPKILVSDKQTLFFRKSDLLVGEAKPVQCDCSVSETDEPNGWYSLDFIQIVLQSNKVKTKTR